MTLWERFPTGDGFFELFKKKLILAKLTPCPVKGSGVPPTCTSWNKGVVCGDWAGNLWAVSSDTIQSFLKGYIYTGPFLAIVGQAISEPNPGWGTGMRRHVVHPFNISVMSVCENGWLQLQWSYFCPLWVHGVIKLIRRTPDPNQSGKWCLGRYPLEQVKVEPGTFRKLKRIWRLGDSSQSVCKISRWEGFYVTLGSFWIVVPKGKRIQGAKFPFTNWYFDCLWEPIKGLSKVSQGASSTLVSHN